jgi:hypothetical protein
MQSNSYGHAQFLYQLLYRYVNVFISSVLNVIKACISFKNLPPFTMSNSYSENVCSSPVLLQNLHENSDGVYCDLKLIHSKTFSLQRSAIQNDIFVTCNWVVTGGSSTVHIYTQTIHTTIQNKKYIEQQNNFGIVRALPRLD